MSKGRPLTIGLIKTGSPQTVKNLNLWGNNLDDLKLLSQMPFLSVASLSVNCISTLKDFSRCNRLEELFLRKNNITDIKEIRYLMKLPLLKVLWLYDNPCTNVENYRLIVIKHLPNLTKLDNDQVTQEEREAAKLITFEIGEEIASKQKIQQKQSKKDIAQDKPIISKINLTTPEHLHKESNHQQSKDEVTKIESQRQQHIVQAISALLKQLDLGSLEAMKRQVDRLLTSH